MATDKNFVKNNWQIIVYLIGIIFVAGVLYANNTIQNETMQTLKIEKADRREVETNKKELDRICKVKLDKAVFDSHEKRDDERYSLYINQNEKNFEQVFKWLNRIENKIDKRDVN